jgi:replicative DNA helicase
MHNPPQHNINLERALLGSILLKPSSFASVSGLVSDSDFYDINNQEIYRAMLGIYEAGLTIDVVSVGQRLDRTPVMALNALLDASATAANILDVARQVRSLSAQRQMVYAAINVANNGKIKQHNVSKYLRESVATIVEASSSNIGNDPSHIKDGMSEITRIALEGRKAADKTDTGIEKFDNKIGGLPGGVLTVIGGRPGMGKSSIALQMAIGIAKSRPVIYFTLEDSIGAMQSRTLSHMSGIPYFDINCGKVGIDDGKKLMLAQSVAMGLNLYFEENRLDADEIAQKAMAFRGARGGIGAVFIDHLGYIADSERHRYQKQYESVSDKMRQLTYLAKQIKPAPVVLLCQLNRGLESRSDKRPMLSDFRDSGKIEEDCRLAILLYRDSVYDEMAVDADIEFIIAKNTNGPSGVIKLDFQKEICTVS